MILIDRYTSNGTTKYMLPSRVCLSHTMIHTGNTPDKIAAQLNQISRLSRTRQLLREAFRGTKHDYLQNTSG